MSDVASNSSVLREIPLFPFQKHVIVHGILCTIGFLGLLPLGALLARYTRTLTPRWFTGHWFIQTVVSGPIIIAGFAEGVTANSQGFTPHIMDPHKRLGIALFILYLAQLAGGSFIHFVKLKTTFIPGNRPLQNYVHAVFGLLIIVLAMYQVRLGYRTEWPVQTALEPIPNGANVLWHVWIVILPVAYVAGLVLLPRQFRQEHAQRNPSKMGVASEENVQLRGRPASDNIR